MQMKIYHRTAVAVWLMMACLQAVANVTVTGKATDEKGNPI